MISNVCIYFYKKSDAPTKKNEMINKQNAVEDVKSC